jgi:beta-1,2-mannosidase
MKNFQFLILISCLLFLSSSCGSNGKEAINNKNSSSESGEWMLGPFVKANDINPILEPDPTSGFVCPIRRAKVNWEEKDVFNPAAVARGGKVYLLYRAEDSIGASAGTSRIGIAESNDGFSFKRLPQPVLYPSNDFMKKYEWEGGIEDPRVVQDDRENYIMTYTAYDGETARLCIAVSPDLIHWEKKGPAFMKSQGGKYLNTWSKAGAILSKLKDGQLAAEKVNGKYWMYWGDVNMNVAVSDNLIDWEPVEDESGALIAVFGPRPGQFDSRLVEPGPPPILREDGIVFIYNSMNLDEGGEPGLPPGTYAAGQVLIDSSDPTKVLKRSDNYFLHPEQDYEITGQVGNVCFLEGLVLFKGTWFLYYGTADSKIAVAEFVPGK